MEDDFKRLHKYVGSKQPEEAKNFLLDIANTFKKELHETVIDEYILNAFDESHGFIAFITVSVSYGGFSEAVTECLELLYMFVNTFTEKIIKYTPLIRGVCLQVLLTNKSSSKEKCRALVLLGLVFEKSDYYPDSFPSVQDLFQTLYNRYEIDSGTVAAQIIKVLAILIKKHHAGLGSTYSLYNSMLRFLEANANKTATVSEVAERFGFFNDYLYVGAECDTKRLYKCIKTRLNTDIYAKAGHIVLSAALNVLRNHVKLFVDEIYKDLPWWQNVLNNNLEARGELQKFSYLTLDVLYENIAEAISLKDYDEVNLMCLEYLEKFTSEINDDNNHGYKLKLAIKGFGHFAKCFKYHLLQEESTKAFVDMILKIEKVYLLNFNPNSGRLDYLPDFIQTLSNIVQQLDNISDYEIGILQKATILLIKLFPNLSNHHHNLVVNPILIAYSHIRKSKKDATKAFLRSIVVEGMIFSCSKPLAYDLIDNPELITYKVYLKLWTNLLNKNEKEFEKWSITHGDAQQILKELFDEVMATLFELISKLNLNTQKREENLTQTDPELSLQAEKVSDFNIFVNLVDLYVELLESVPMQRFQKWAPFYLNFNINKSKKHPLVSGFYKLIAVGLNITNSLKYFSEERLRSEDIKDTFNIIANFINSVMAKINLYKEDLKLSCIRVILAAPILYVSDNLKSVTPIIVALFTLARSNLTLAKIGMETLESWYQVLPQSEFEEFIKTILPTLDSYLSSKSLSETFDAQILNERKTKQTLSKRRIVTVAEGDLLQVQKKILSFLGNLSADVCMTLVEGNNSISPQSIGKSTLLKVDLVYNNLNIPIYLEKFIPRVIELALYCSERKLQITACETLHAIVLVLLGTSKIDESKEMDKLLKTVFYPLLQLGCYPDNTVQQIIKPLVEQLVHWYATPAQRKTNKLVIVIESLMDAVTQTEDTALRDFSCVCIHEFIKYTLKNITGNHIEDDIENVKLIIRKIKQFSYHSDPAKRLAAALIFNNIYTLLREERYIVDTYWLELFQFLMYNLSQVDENDPFDCLTQIIQGIDHIERVFLEKSDLFNKTSKKRRVPIGLSGDTLDCVIDAAFSYRTTKNVKARNRLYDFYYKLSSCAQNKSKNITSICYPVITTPDFENGLSAAVIISWLKNLLFALDTELSIYQHEKEKHAYSKDQNLFDSLQLYLKNIEPHTIQTFNNVYKNVIIKPPDQEDFKKLKFEVTKCAIIYLITASFYENDQEINEILQVDGIPVLCDFIFDRFNFIDDQKHEEIIHDLFSKITRFDDVFTTFKCKLHTYIGKNYSFEYELVKNIPLKQRQLLRGLIVLRKSPIKDNLNIDVFLNTVLNNMLKKITYERDGLTYAIKMTDSAKKYCDLLIDLYLENNNFEIFIEKLCNQTQVINVDRNETLSFGKYLYALCKSTILQQLFRNFTKLFEMISQISEDDNFFFTKEILNYITSNRKKLDEAAIADVFKLILSKWHAFLRFFEDNIDNKTMGLKLLEKISNLTSNDFNKSLLLTERGVYEWILTCFRFEHYRILPQRKYQHMSNIFSALPVLLGYQDTDLTQLWNELDVIQGAYFTNIKESRHMHEAATLVINKSFQNAITAKSNKFFLFSCNIYVMSHLRSDINTEEYCRLFMTNSTETDKDLLRDIYEICTNLTKLPLEESYQLADSILVSLLRYVKYDIFESFFVEIIKDVMVYISSKDENDESIVRKLVGYVLLKSLFSRINVENFDDKTCPITQACNDNVETGRELLRSATKVTSSYLKEPIDESFPAKTKEYMRLCKCQCYNALISIISNSITAETSGNESYYNILFNRDANGENVLWRNVVDTAKNYAFPIVFDKYTVNIRTQHQEKNDQVNDLNYIESQNIFNSTLKEDICLYDFSKSIVRSQVGDYIPNKPQVEMEISIDAEELDSHECMANICGLIKKIHSEKIYKDSETPKWVELINKELQGENVPLNVKLFLLKIIEKDQEIFKPFAKVLAQSIIELIADKKIGEGINYFVADLIIMLSSWSEIANKPLNVSNLLQFLMENVNMERADVRRYHLNLVKLVVESWRDSITVPIDYLFSKMEDLKDSKKVDVIIHFYSIFIANELPPWDKDTLKKYAKKIIELLTSTTSSVVTRTCAETIGMSLKYLAKHDEANTRNFEEFTIKTLKKFDISKRLNCLQSIMKHYPKICDPFLNTLIHELNKSKIKGFCLRIFVECINALHECSDLQALDLRSLTNDYDDHLKTLGMEIIRKTIPHIQISDRKGFPKGKLRLSLDYFKSLMDDLSKFTTSDNHIIRNIMYEIFIDIYNNKNFSENEETKKRCVEVLLQGLTDRNDEVREKMTKFWMEKMPPEISERFSYVITNMYNPKMEEYFLSYSINFLLKDLDVSGKLFSKPLLEKDFSFSDIKDNWRTRHSSYAPLFASTYRSQELFSSGLNSNSGSSDDLILASDDMEFEPTMNSLAYDTQELLGRSFEGNDEEKDGEFKVPLPVTNKIYKQRFRKDVSHIDRQFAIRQIDKKVQKEQKRQDDIKQRQQGASIYRRYRVGEIPDIEICLSDICLPLKKLIENDAHLAQLFFTSFFGEMLTKGKKEFSETYLSDIALAINHIFKNSILYNTYFIGALLDVAIKNKDAVSFSPSIISKVCLNSGLLSSGIMLLEEYLISNCEYEVSAKRSTNLSDNPELNCWVKLADLYRELQDWDIVRAIFLSKMNSNETIIKAIDAESQGYWKNACELYSRVIRADTCLETRDFYYESYYKCFAELSDWESVTKSIKATASSGNFWDDLWDQDWNQAKLLPWYITAEIRNSLDDEDRMNEFTSLLNSSMADSTKANYIKTNFSEEIAFLYLINDNIDKSMFYVQNNLERFLENWQNTSPMLTFLRTNKLMKIRNTVDIYNFINKVNVCEEDTLLKNAKDLVAQWLKVSEERLLSIVPLETRNIYRGECLASLKPKIGDGILQTQWDQVKFTLDMQLVDVALQMRNFNVARKYCQINSEYQDTTSTNGVRFTLNYGKLLQLKASLLADDADGKDSLFVKAYELIVQCLDSPIAADNVELTLSSATILYDLSLNMADTVSKGTSAQAIKEQAVEKFSNTLNTCRNSPSIGNSAVLSEIGTAYVKIAHFARDSNQFSIPLIMSVLRAMYYGSSEGRQMFPCLLDIEGIGTIHKDTFLTECESLPEWLFIQWIPQLLSKLDTSCIFVIDSIVLKLATAYPQSIMYAYKLSKEKFNAKIEDANVRKHLEKTLIELDKLLNNTVANYVIEALSSVATASNLLHFHITQLVNACHRSDGDSFKRLFDDLESFCREVDYDDTASKIGAVHKRVRELSKDLLKLKDVKFQPDKMLQNLSRIWKKIKDSEETPNNRTARYTSRLSYYSPYLENFMDNQTNYNVDLEIPGQYVGDRKPLLQYHTKISGFSSEVSILRSLRKPIQITIFGNDGKDHGFLVKVGEDLRQDQRIEQIFGLMNDIFDSDPACREHRLKISTYQVIPLTCTLGLIHWVRNTVDLRKFLGKTVPTCKDTKFAAITKTFQNRYIGRLEPGKEHYDKALLKNNASTVVPIYRELVNKMPFDIFRQALQSLCPNSETFLTLRNNFMTSFVCSCIANWILGIGDRHLGNTLISLDNARTIDVDFGHAFGSGVQIQFIPELVPFRLTPHIVDLMQPMQEHGLIEETMIHVLRALRENHKSLMSTVRVFMNEPSMDWLQYKKFENNALGYNWDPEEKIRHTEMKITGFNPVDVMVVELKNRTRDSKEVIEKLIEHVGGNERENVRARLKGCLSVEDQVKCLLDHATDPNLLCRMFHGWEAWI